ncbi:unnamed protein product [Meloidogyne enterolobii]|uniref:Uncharacterized protein n=1 Tax=Meloidogyne enterolobii TaxID=390850 RepID=A0ACB1A6W0_MELEN
MTKIYSFTFHNSNLPAIFQCDNWTAQQVAEWLNGVDDGMAPYIRHFVTHNITGSKLLNVDNDTLKRIGVNREASRAKIISAINLLLYYSYSIKYENLQKLALKTRVCTNEILEAVSTATPIINNSSNASMHIEVLNNVLGALASTYENTIRLIFWLERNPFVGNKKYAKMRNNLATYVDEMVDCVNNPNNPKFFSVPQLLIEVC